MTIPKELFELRVTTDDPRFEGFALTDAPSILGGDSLEEDIVPGSEVADSDPFWKQPRFGDKWVPPKVIGRVAPFNDYPGLDMMFPAFSERSVELLMPYLKPNGEILPLRSDTRVKYFFYNITTISDALDHKHSKCDFWCDPPTTTDSIEFFAFDKSKLKELSIFRIREWPIGVLVTDEFVRETEQAGLNGFDFVKIWPLDPSTDWRKRGAQAITSRKSSVDLKSQTLVLILPIRGRKLDSKEKKEVNKIEDEIDAQLVISSLNSPYFGSLEGNDIVGNQYRIFITTPDVERLVMKLQPWLDSLVWREPIGMLKRFGNLHDVDAVEEFSMLNAAQ